MLSNVLSHIGDLVNLVLGAMSGIISLWPVAVMIGFLILGIGLSSIKKLAGARRGKRRAK